MILSQSFCISVYLISYCLIVLLSYCFIVLLSCCLIVLLSYCLIFLLSYCLIVLLSYCLIVLLSYCLIVLWSCCLVIVCVVCVSGTTTWCAHISFKPSMTGVGERERGGLKYSYKGSNFLLRLFRGWIITSIIIIHKNIQIFSI